MRVCKIKNIILIQEWRFDTHAYWKQSTLNKQWKICHVSELWPQPSMPVHAKVNSRSPLDQLGVKCSDFPSLSHYSNLNFNASSASLTSRLLLWWIFKMYWKKICPPCWNIVGLCPADSLINYGQTGRKESRHIDRHLCSIVRRVITFMPERGRHPGRQTGQQRHETDKYNRSTESVRQD